jgi:alpha-L-rhamnosidase
MLLQKVQVLESVARELNENSFSEKYSRLASAMSNQIRDLYYNHDSNTFGSMGADAYAVALGIVSGDDAERMMDRVAYELDSTQSGRITCGSVTLPYLLQSLTRFGHQDLVWDFMTRTEYPGYGAMLATGHGTIWEGWRTPIRSQQEFGGAIRWLPETLAGVRPDPANPGFVHFFIEPYLPDNLDSVSLRFSSPRGFIESSWRKENERVYFDIEIPPGTMATVRLPVDATENLTESVKPLDEVRGMKAIDHHAMILSSGRYRFAVSKECITL